jgi:predicted ATP-dependent endonuclease of OLD family
MLKSITFKQNFRCFKKGQSFQFEALTLLVGDQGSGKSSILQLLAANDTKSPKRWRKNRKRGIGACAQACAPAGNEVV